jgi:hypothetical protein
MCPRIADRALDARGKIPRANVDPATVSFGGLFGRPLLAKMLRASPAASAARVRPPVVAVVLMHS